MLVELVGCSGAGKSTVARRAVDIARASGMPPESVALMPDEMLARSHLGRVSNEQLINVIEDVAAFPHLVRAWPDCGPFLRASCARIRTQDSSIGRRMLDMRSAARRVGMFERARRTEADRVVLFDEGPVQSAHVFAYDTHPYTSQDIEAFLRSVPLPDVVVHVTAPVDDLVVRAGGRVEVRRRLRGKDPAEVARLLTNAAHLFEALAAALALRTRVLTVSNAGTEGAVDDAAAIWLAEQIVEWCTPSHGSLTDASAKGSIS